MRAKIAKAAMHLRESAVDLMRNAITDGVRRGVLHSSFCECDTCRARKERIVAALKAKIEEGLGDVEIE